MNPRPAGLSRPLILAGMFSLGASALTAVPPGGDTYLQRALAVIESEHPGLCPTTASQKEFKATLARLAAENRAETASGPSGPASVQALNRMVFGRLGMRASANLKDPCNLLPSRVLEPKQGYCVGIAAIYLMLAERLGLPLYAVATPSHVFLRYDDGTTRINIETLQNGTDVPDAQYIREEKIPEASIRKGVFMHNLTADEFISQIHNNLGVIYSEGKEYAAAAEQYREASELGPRCPTAYYNYGNDLLAQAEYRRAATLFSKSLRLYPTDAWALNNRGLAYVKMGKLKKARKDFEEALRTNPGFEAARRNLEELPAPSESP